MEPQSDPPGGFTIESETKLQSQGSTLAGLGARSLTPALDLLLILVPDANDAAAFAPFVHAIESQVEPPFSVMIVFDPTDDALLAVASEFARTRPWLDLVPNKLGPGEVNALRVGFRAAGHGPVAVMSLQGTDAPGDLSRMRRLYPAGHAMVSGSREMRHGSRRGGSRVSRTIGRWTNRFVRNAGRFLLSDPLSRFRVYDAATVNEMEIESERAEDVPLELAAKATVRGLSIIEIPTTWHDHGIRRMSVDRLFKLSRWWKWCRLARQRTATVALTPPLMTVKTATGRSPTRPPSDDRDARPKRNAE